MDPRDAGRDAAAWTATGLVDLDFYGALRATRFDDAEAAARDWVEVGMAEGLSPHPLLDFHSLPPELRRRWRRGDVDAVLAHLGPGGGPVGPLVAHPAADEALRGMRELAVLLGRESAGEVTMAPARAPGPLDDRLTSVLVVAASLQPAARAAHRVAQEEPGAQLVVVDQGLPAHAALGLHARLLRDGAEGVRLAPGATYDEALAHGLARVRGGRLVVVAAHALVREGCVVGLSDRVGQSGDRVVAPVVLDELDLVVSPPELSGHPPEDAAERGPWTPRRPLDVAALATPTTPDGAAGLRRTLTGSAGAVGLVATARVTSVAEPGGSSSPAPTSASRPVGRRWSLRLPSPPGHRGDRWGDTYFAEALARSLRRRGDEVVTRRRGAHELGPTGLDHVNLVIRGLHPVPASRDRLDVLWVISHPDDVDVAELDGYDVVCAASVPWSEELAARSGRDVVPLLQASEFAQAAVDFGSDPAVVFVGNVDPRRERPMVARALEAGVPLAVYGRGWSDLPAGVWRGEHVPNHRLPELYRRHGVVLADHWPDMARHGFVANRVFDAVAAGASVVSDEVAGMATVLDADRVRTAPTAAALAEAVAALRSAGAPVASARTAVSFDDRAATLCRLVDGA